MVALRPRPPARSPAYHAPPSPRRPALSDARYDDRDEDAVSSLLRENAALEARNRHLSHQVEDLEAVIKRLWAKRGVGAPSSRELREIAAQTQRKAEHERQEADDARRAASQHLRGEMQAKSEAFVSLSALRDANMALEDERSATREWQAADARDLSRRMADLTRRLELEQHKVAILEAAAERAEAQRADDVGRVLAELESVRASTSERVREQREAASAFSHELGAAHETVDGLRREAAWAAAEHAEELRRRDEATERERERTASASVLMGGHVADLASQLAQQQDETARLRRQLTESRDSHARLSASARETEQRLTAETVRLRAVVERLGGEAAESRSALLARIETLTLELLQREQQSAARLAEVEEERHFTERRMGETLSKLRWLQSKALEEGGARPGRYRTMLYWESLKNADAPPNSMSWRSDLDKDSLSQVASLEHQCSRPRRGAAESEAHPESPS